MPGGAGRIFALMTKKAESSPGKHVWVFKARFRRHAFGWRSQPAITRVREAVSEIKEVARKDPALAGEGAVAFLERVAPALEQVDSSSGSIGTAVNRAVEVLAAIVAAAPVEAAVREKWLERLWQAYLDDDMPYIELLGEHWGEMCVSREIASRWADELTRHVRSIWAYSGTPGTYCKATTPCLSALFVAERYDELLSLLDADRSSSWWDSRWGFKALAAQGRRAEALRYAEASRGLNQSDAAISRACEELLLASGFADEAYARYALEAVSHETTYLARYRALAKRYPQKAPAELLADLVGTTPGEEGKWFATAKAAGLYDEAMALANLSPCDPLTLARAARDFADENPAFALEAAVAALRWIGAGYGYEIAAFDVSRAYDSGLRAAERLGMAEAFRARVRALVAGNEGFLKSVLGRELAAGASAQGRLR